MRPPLWHKLRNCCYLTQVIWGRVVVFTFDVWKLIKNLNNLFWKKISWHFFYVVYFFRHIACFAFYLFYFSNIILLLYMWLKSFFCCWCCIHITKQLIKLIACDTDLFRLLFFFVFGFYLSNKILFHNLIKEISAKFNSS